MQEIQGLARPLLGWILEASLNVQQITWLRLGEGCGVDLMHMLQRPKSNIGCAHYFQFLYFPAFRNLFESLNHPCGHPAVASDLTKTLKWVKDVLDRAEEEVTEAPKPGETK